MAKKRSHFAGIAVLVLAGALIAALWWIDDSLRYGNASPLHRAAMHGDLVKAKRLIAQGADINARMFSSINFGTWDATPLHIAARHNQAAIVEELIRAGADKDAIDKLGYSALHAALADRADACAQSLIRAGAQLHAPQGDSYSSYAIDNDGQPLRTALQRGSVSTVKMMLDRGADVEADVGDDAVSWVDAPDLLDKIRLLSAHGYAVDAAGPDGGSALHAAARANDVESIRFLLDHGADIERRGSQYGLTPLLTAAYFGSNDAVKILIERGADAKAGTSDFGSPVYAAAFSGKSDTVRALLAMKLGIDLQAGRSSDKATPLHMAYWNGDSQMARVLIDAGADPNARTTDGRLPAEFRK